MNTNDNDRLLDTYELANKIGVHRNTVRNWRNSGLIPYIKPTPNVIRYRWADVEEALNRHSVKATD